MIIEFHDHHGKLDTKIDPFEKLVQTVITSENYKIKELNIILVTDEFLKDMHGEYLSDDTETDVITFDLSEGEEIEAEIYISYDRALAHCGIYNVELTDELARLLVHGLLHLAGFNDFSEDEQLKMRAKEDEFLAKYWN